MNTLAVNVAMSGTRETRGGTLGGEGELVVTLRGGGVLVGGERGGGMGGPTVNVMVERSVAVMFRMPSKLARLAGSRTLACACDAACASCEVEEPSLTTVTSATTSVTSTPIMTDCTSTSRMAATAVVLTVGGARMPSVSVRVTVKAALGDASPWSWRRWRAGCTRHTNSFVQMSSSSASAIAVLFTVALAGRDTVTEEV